MNGRDNKSLDLFGIYDTIGRMKLDEVKNNVSMGFNDWGNGKNCKNPNVDLKGKSGNKAPENLHYIHSSCLVVERNSFFSPVVLSSNISVDPQPATIPEEKPSVEATLGPTLAMTEAPVAQLKLTTTVAILVQISSPPANSVVPLSATIASPIGFLGDYSWMSDIEVSEESLSHPPDFSEKIYKFNDMSWRVHLIGILLWMK